MKKKVRKGFSVAMALLIGLGALYGCFLPAKPAQAAGNGTMLGEIRLFPYGKAPRGWVLGEGQELRINTNTALFSLLGTNYGGDGQTTFALPDLTGKEPNGIEGASYYINIDGGIFPPREGFSGDAMLGEVRIFPYTFAPGGYLSLETEQTVKASQYPLLFDLLAPVGAKDEITLPKIAPLLGDKIKYCIATEGLYPSSGGRGDMLFGEIGLSLFEPSEYELLEADGMELPIAQHTVLFSLIGFKFGGTDSTFNLPDLTSEGPLRYFIMDTGIFPQFNPPIGKADSYFAIMDTQLSVPAENGVLANDQEATNAAVSASPQHGSLSFNSNGSFTYTPITGYTGSDSFTYIPSNGWGDGDAVDVQIEVIDTRPAGVEDRYEVNANKALSVSAEEGLLKNDSNASGVVLYAPPGIGSVILNPDGSFVYTPKDNFAGLDSFVYKPINGGTEGGPVTVTITVVDPGPSVSGVEDGGLYNRDVTIKFENGTAVLDGNPIGSGTTVSAEGSHTLVVTGITGGDPITISFKIDKTAPVVTGVANGETYLAGVTISYEEGAATLDGVPFASGSVITASGSHTLIVSDEAGNVTTVRFTVRAPIVSYESNGGTAVKPEIVEYGSAAAKPVDPERTGYAFAGWYKDGGLAQAYDFAAPVTADLMLYAKWTINAYTVKYDSNGGAAVNSETVKYGSAATKPKDPTRTGYAFAGWYRDSGLTQAYDFAAPVTGDLALYAKWKHRTFTVEYDSNGGSGVRSEIVEYNGKAKEPADPKRAGYAFAGWYQESGLEHRYNFNRPVTEDLLLYARWRSTAPETIPGSGGTSGGNGGGASGSGSGIELTDIAGHWAEAAIKEAIEIGFITGYEDSRFRPNQGVNRAEFITMLARALELPDTGEALRFADSDGIPAYARTAIAQAVELGIVSGYSDGTFAPRKQLNRAEMVAMIVRAGGIEVDPYAKLSFSDAKDVPAWAVPYISAAADNGFASGVGQNRFAPRNIATRAEAVALILALLHDR